MPYTLDDVPAVFKSTAAALDSAMPPLGQNYIDKYLDVLNTIVDPWVPSYTITTTVSGSGDTGTPTVTTRQPTEEEKAAKKKQAVTEIAQSIFIPSMNIWKNALVPSSAVAVPVELKDSTERYISVYTSLYQMLGMKTPPKSLAVLGSYPVIRQDNIFVLFSTPLIGDEFIYPANSQAPTVKGTMVEAIKIVSPSTIITQQNLNSWAGSSTGSLSSSFFTYYNSQITAISLISTQLDTLSNTISAAIQEAIQELTFNPSKAVEPALMEPEKPAADAEALKKQVYITHKIADWITLYNLDLPIYYPEDYLAASAAAKNASYGLTMESL